MSSNTHVDMINRRDVFMASDHAAYHLKSELIEHLKSPQFQSHTASHHQVRWNILDLGPTTATRCDYPDYAWKLACKVADTPNSLGILLCGTGIGVSMAANRHPSIRAALAHNVWTAQMAREHNDAQVLCIGARVIGPDLAWAMVQCFLHTPALGGRHAQRVAKMQALALPANHSS